MSLYAIADTHLSFGTDKPMDSFEGWQDYTSRLKNNWNKTFKNYRMLIELVNLSVFLFFTFSIINLFYMADRKNIYYDKIKFLIGASSFRVFIEE